MTQTVIRSANGVVDAGNKINRFGMVLYGGLDDCEFIASQSRDEIGVADALAQAQEVSDYQAIGVRCREAILAFTNAAQIVVPWTSASDMPKGAASSLIVAPPAPSLSSTARRVGSARAANARSTVVGY